MSTVNAASAVPAATAIPAAGVGPGASSFELLAQELQDRICACLFPPALNVLAIMQEETFTSPASGEPTRLMFAALKKVDKKHDWRDVARLSEVSKTLRATVKHAWKTASKNTVINVDLSEGYSRAWNRLSPTAPVLPENGLWKLDNIRNFVMSELYLFEAFHGRAHHSKRFERLTLTFKRNEKGPWSMTIEWTPVEGMWTTDEKVNEIMSTRRVQMESSLTTIALSMLGSRPVGTGVIHQLQWRLQLVHFASSAQQLTGPFVSLGAAHDHGKEEVSAAKKMRSIPMRPASARDNGALGDSLRG